MTFNLAILDDNTKDLDMIYNTIQQFFHTKSLDIHIHSYQNVEDFPMEQKFDVIFLDIDMPKKSGFDIAKEYKTYHKNILIIFVTSHNELVYKACNIHPFDFIRKENLNKEIPLVLEEVIYKLTDLYPTSTFYINGNAFIIQNDAIVYCESFNHSTEIHFEQSSITVNQQLSDVLKTINSDHFKRVGRSYIVNMKKVKKFEGNTLYMDHDYEVQISRRNKKMILEFLMEVQNNAHVN